jgi:hypothetical protein
MSRPADERLRRHDAKEGGFILAMVVALLFTISVAGATGYMVVSSEFALASADQDGREALAAARAGIHRFVSEQLGQVGSTVDYAIGDAVVTVTARKLAEQDSLNHRYYLTAEATVSDIRTPDLPARRSVGAYATHRLSPIPHKGALWVSGGTTYVYGYLGDADIDGSDHATTGDCSGGGTAGVAGMVRVGAVNLYGFWPPATATISGSPATRTYAGFSAFSDSTNLRWDVLSNPDFPVDFEQAPPDFGSLPADSFPVVRYNGNLDATTYWSGRGVLIVTGRLRTFYNFEWDGIILAGELGYSYAPSGYDEPEYNGMVIGGLNSSNPTLYVYNGRYNYHSCNVYAANRSLSYLELMENTVVELN